MHAFKDAEGRDWILSINVNAVRRVRALAGVDLPGLVGGGLGELLNDPVKFVDVLFVLVKPEAERRQLTDEDFGASLGGDALEKAAEAFVEELIDFFPAPRRGPLRALMQKAKAAAAAEMGRLEQRIEALDPEDPGTWGGTPGASSGATPGPSASTPDGSPSGS